ncbi:MAG: hypothetical protein HYU66_19020, partial [Armatimonadetes bacterium]|nr:hypothetical protein [Armatimonadota bacterium]
KPGETVKVPATVEAGDVAIAVASALDDGVAPTLAIAGAKPEAVCRHGFLNQRSAAVVMRPEKQQKVELEVGCAEDHSGPVLLRVTSAMPVEPGKPVNGALASFQDFAFYRLPFPDEVRYDVKVAAGKGVDTLLMSFSLPPQRLAAMPIPDQLNDDGSAPPSKGSSALVWRSDYGRQGLVCVTAARPGTLGPYRLQVTALIRADVPQPKNANRAVPWPSAPDG